MANRNRGTVDVELDGDTHQLRYTLNALAEVEDRLKLGSISEILDAVKALSMRSLRTLLWAGLMHENPRLTEQEVGDMEFDFPHAVERVSQAIALVFQREAPEAPEGNARRPGRGAGAKP